jgi:hypothetical protein
MDVILGIVLSILYLGLLGLIIFGCTRTGSSVIQYYVGSNAPNSEFRFFMFVLLILTIAYSLTAYFYPCPENFSPCITAYYPHL